MSENQEPGGPPVITPASAGPLLMNIADRVIGRPLLIHPTKAEVILHVLEGRLPLDGAALSSLSPDASRFSGSQARGSLNRVADGVAIIPIIGSLVNRGAWIGAYSGMTSYEGIAAQIRDAAGDPRVKSIMLDLDSPGGEATGMFALAEQVREAAKTKPVVALVNDMAASAAYGIASAATEIVVSPTSIVGSIGVVLTHFDRSGELEKKGVRATLIYAGANKVDGNPFGPLSDAVRADLQSEVSKFYNQFVSLVAQGRGDRLTEQDARATEARTFLGQEAIDRGLADRMASFDAVLASLQSGNSGPSGAHNKGSRKMTEQTTTPAAGITQEAHTTAVSAARAEGEAAGRKAGAEAAKERIGAILGCDEAKGREALASHFAFKTEMGLDDVKAALAASPSASAETKPSLEQRSRAAGDFAADVIQPNKAQASNDVWSAAIKEANLAIGAA